MTTITNLELAVLKNIDSSGFGNYITDDIWFWADEMANEIGISAKAVGGVVTSLQEKKLVRVFIASAADRREGDESTIAMTPAGVAAYVAAVGQTNKPQVAA